MMRYVTFTLVIPVIISFVLVLSGDDRFYDYSRIDTHVLNTPPEVESNLLSLAAYLVKPARTDREKIRALFCWITENITYDIESYRRRNHKQQDSEQILDSKTAVCDGYAGLLSALGTAVGLEVTQIIGYSKGYDYVVGSSFHERPNHAWNAVKIEGQWHLLDPTWGAGYIDENDQYIKQFQEHYFLTPPDKFLYDHLPQEPQWQLVSRTSSLQEFEELPYLKGTFFDYGLSIKSHYKSIIRTAGVVEVIFYAPDDVALVGQLFQNNKVLLEQMTFSQRKSGQYTIYAHCPQRGSYILRLFVKRKKESATFHWAADYKIETSQGVGDKSVFPFCYGTFYEEGVYLFEPLSGQLKSGREHRFKLFVPRCLNVAVKMNDQWFPLEQQGSIFEGSVPAGPGKVSVYGKFKEGQHYDALLEYVSE